ncbi:TPA: hypothetical protein HA280_04880 [Candidatus Woesearchaeota archaeon]|nr:hypothetical protein [Candidatus Woesearchaeota archaeon]
MKFGVHYAAWIGGEPLVPSARDITLGISERNQKVATIICTNGDFVDEKAADRIASSRSIVPFISIDGLRDLHDKRRGEGSYDNALKAMGRFKERKAMIGYSTTITSENFREVSSERFMDEMVKIAPS